MLFFACGVRAIEAMNGQDGYLYAGASARPYDFLARFPDAYYGMRFGYILPSWVLNRLFGVEAGFFLLRFGLLGSICLIMRLSGRLAPSVALFAAVVVSTSPIIAVATFNTYVMATAVLGFVIGAVLLATVRDLDSRGLARVAMAGAAVAVAWNSHFVALPIGIVVFAAFVVDHVVQRPRHPLKGFALYCAAFAIGTFVVVAGGVLIYGLRFGVWDVYGPSLAQSRRSTDGFFLEPGFRWLSWRHYLLVGPLGLVAGALAWRTEADEFVRVVLRRLTVFTGVSLALFASLQWLQNSPLLATYFYSALPLSLGTVTLALASAAVIRRETQHTRVLGVALVAAILVAIVLGSQIGGRYAIVLSGSIVVMALGVASMTVTRLRGLAVGAILVAAAWASVSSPHDFPGTPGGYRTDPFYDDMFFAYDPSTMDRVEMVDQLSRALPSLPTERGELLVWFDSAQPYDQLTAPFVWYRSALQGPADAPMPQMTATVRERVLDRRPRFIVIIDGQESDADLGAAEIAALAPYSVAWKRAFSRGDLAAHVILLERAAGTWRDFPCSTGDDGKPLICS
ncbi:MAG: hypothetical protein AB7L17_14300 [Ilumatobacteraceae bacterium]